MTKLFASLTLAVFLILGSGFVTPRADAYGCGYTPCYQNYGGGSIAYDYGYATGCTYGCGNAYQYPAAYNAYAYPNPNLIYGNTGYVYPAQNYGYYGANFFRPTVGNVIANVALTALAYSQQPQYDYYTYAQYPIYNTLYPTTNYYGYGGF